MNPTLQQSVPTRITLRATVLLLAGAFILPFLVHLLPAYEGVPMGARLLPMFIVPFIAVAFFNVTLGLVIGGISPLMNVMLTGSPDWQFVVVLSLELMLFAIIVSRFLKMPGVKWVAAPVAYMAAKIASLALLFIVPLVANIEPAQFFINSMVNAWLGILLLGVVNILVLRYQMSKAK
ncbi:MAG: hypothetical protein AAF632_08090 [Bacteroidota bacterium]